MKVKNGKLLAACRISEAELPGARAEPAKVTQEQSCTLWRALLQLQRSTFRGDIDPTDRDGLDTPHQRGQGF